MSDRIINFIKDEIESLSDLKKKVTGGSIFIQCPYHNDNTPSGGINIDSSKTVPLGWFSCLGCGESKSWNDLAATLGIRQLKKRSQTEVTPGDYLDPSRMRDALLGGDDDLTESDRDKERDEKRITFFDFPPELTKWRGYKTKFLAKLGCRYAFFDDDHTGGEFIIWIPCIVNKEVVGYVKAFLEKEKGRPSYINSPGKWSRSKGLLFFDYAIKMMKEQGHKTIVLCEGPRDAMRLLRYGIPAVCILGTQSWSDEKRLILEQSPAENVVIFMDGDLPNKQGVIPGKVATQKIVKSLRGYMNYKYINLWKYEKGWDPGNCPRRFLDRVQDALTSF